MKKWTFYMKWICCICMCLLGLAGCSGKESAKTEPAVLKDKETEAADTKTSTPMPKEPVETPGKKEASKPQVTKVDWSEYFDGLKGAAVVYNASERQYMIYNKKLAMTQNSPCSTFKIISSLIALENGIIQPDNSTHTWSGEMFWNENWNHDIDFMEAFQVSCVWYFREVIDEIGKKKMQEELDKLRYGNCDISDWKGRLNTNNNNRALTGFWIESSLKISPKEQVEVMERIFGGESVYSKKTQNELKKAMLTMEKKDASIYGKTGMGMAHGVVVDAWFTGFARNDEEEIYFCIYLGNTDDREVSSLAAKEIAVRILSDYMGYHFSAKEVS